MTSTSIVNDKIGSALVCQHRPLREGEKPKEPGRSTVYEATGELNPEFRQALKDGVLEASWKVDGTCCLIKGGRLYRRLDIRDGKGIPEGAIPGEKDENGQMKICWLLVNGSTDPQDCNHLSALDPKGGFWTLDENLEPAVRPFTCRASSQSQCDFTDEEIATYELIGPKVGPNPYLLKEVEVTLQIMTKGKLKDRAVMRHYLVRHGDYKIRDFPSDQLLASPDPVEFFRNMIRTNKVEGIVFRHLSHPKVFYKINQGHIGTLSGHHHYVLWPDRLTNASASTSTNAGATNTCIFFFFKVGEEVIVDAPNLVSHGQTITIKSTGETDRASNEPWYECIHSDDPIPSWADKPLPYWYKQTQLKPKSGIKLTHLTTEQLKEFNKGKWQLHLDPRNALYLSQGCALDDDNAVCYIDHQFQTNRSAFRHVAQAAAWSGRIVAVKRVLELGWPIVYEYKDELDGQVHVGIDDMMHNILCWNRSPEQMCALIDLLVSYGADVNRSHKGVLGSETPLQTTQNAIKHLNDPWDGTRWRDLKGPETQNKITIWKVAAERLKYHGAK